MQIRTSIRLARCRAAQLASFALATLLAGVAAPAHADSDFENAFERQLGRILAFEAVAASKALLFPGAVPYPAPAYYPAPMPVARPVPVPVAVPVPVPYYAVPVARPVVYYRAKHWGHGHGRGHGRGYGRGYDCD